MKKRQRTLVISMVILLVSVGLGVFVVFWGGFLAQKSQTQEFSPHYLAFEGVQTRIYAVSQTSSYTYANQTYVSSNGVTVANGSVLFAINLALRNDYSSDNPPPNTGTPVSPVDGTAYIRVKPILLDGDKNFIPTVNISPSDFQSPAGETGLVLASGQTINVQLVLANYQSTVTSYAVNLASVGDSVPR